MRRKVIKMKSKPKSKVLFLITLGAILALLPIINSNLIFGAVNSNTIADKDIENLKLSKISGKIHIDGNSEWLAFKNDGNCTGSGSYSDPYVIEDLVIDGGGSGSCILIENSDAYFIVRNCSLYNSGSSSDNAGIKLDNADNGKIINNNCSDNNGYGIYLDYSDNNTLSGNTISNNSYHGILLYDYSDNNTLSGNTANNNSRGINLYNSDNNTLSGNTANNNTNDGINLWYSNNNNLSGNTVYNNTHGIYLVECNNNTLSENSASNNYFNGIILSSGNNNTLSGNTASNNNLYGIILSSGNNSMISGNTAYNNTYGIYLAESNNNTLSENNANNNTDGIYLWYSDNNTLSGNTANNSDYGILIYYSDNNTLSGNKVNNSTYGIGLSGNNNTLLGNTAYNSTYGIGLSGNNNTLSGNTAYNNGIGIYFGWGGINNMISGNTAYNNTHGIALLNSNNSMISGNTASNNNAYGISLSGNNNTLSGNTAYNNTYGIILSGNNNKIFLNHFINNEINAEDNGINNRWDNGTVGNYWDDYSGNDANDDGIGDTPYTISGSAGSQDDYPIFWDPPVFSVNLPSPNDYFAIDPPIFDIFIEEGVVNLTWYTLDSGIVNKTFTGLTGTIDQALWDSISEGDVTIRFYVNDSAGNIAFEEVTINKDTTAPIITINSPSTDEIFGNNAPGYNLTIIESNIHTMWYTLDSGTTNFTFTGLTGTIDQTIWDSISEGDVTIRFYVNDSAGNITFEEIEVIKRIPEVTGIPGYNLFFILGILSVVAIIISTKLKKFNK